MYPWVVKHKALVCGVIIGLRTVLAFPLRDQSLFLPCNNVFDITSELSDAEVELSLSDLCLNDLIALNKLIDDTCLGQRISEEYAQRQKPAMACGGKQEVDFTHFTSKNNLWRKRSSAGPPISVHAPANACAITKNMDKFCASQPDESKYDKSSTIAAGKEPQYKEMKRQLSYLEAQEETHYELLKRKLKHLKEQMSHHRSQSEDPKNIQRSSLQSHAWSRGSNERVSN